MGYKEKYALWQYTAERKLPGVSGRVDLARSYRDFLPEITVEGYRHYAQDGPEMQPLSDMRPEVFGPMNCQSFYTPDVYDVAGTLAHGFYAALSHGIAPYGSFTWARIAVESAVYWTALLTN